MVAMVAMLATAASVGCGSGTPRSGPVSSRPPTAVEANATVVHIVDGDTIDVQIGGADERVRLTGIDTPEIAHEPSGDRPGNDAECFADAAHGFVAALLPAGTEVRLERDVVGRDDYGRLLAYVYRASDDLFINYEIVRQGYARPLTIAPNVAHSELMVQAARDAERADAGLWSACR